MNSSLVPDVNKGFRVPNVKDKNHAKASRDS